MIVLNERLISGHVLDWSNNAKVSFVGALPEIYEQIHNELEGKILFSGGSFFFEPIHSYFKQHLRYVKHLYEKLSGIDDLEMFFRESESHIHNKSFVELLEDYANPLCLSEFARSASLPFALSSSEDKKISVFEKIESRTCRGIVEVLRQRLNEGARNELFRLAELGEQTVFPRTPIAWQIVRESHKPLDLLRVALELREEYKTFRKAMIELETELLNQSTTLERKIKIRRDVLRLADELWAHEEGQTQKVTKEVSDLLGTAAKAATGFSVVSTASLTKSILSFPTDQILQAMRRRKVRVMLKAKKDFLKGKKWTQKLSTIFGLSEDTIKQALAYSKKITTWEKWRKEDARSGGARVSS